MYVKKGLEQTIVSLYERGYRVFVAGGALGFDTMAAKAVLMLRENGYPDIKLVLALPCRSQTAGWGEGEIAVYETICSLADQVIYVSETYFSGCMHKRNRYMVDHSSVCISYMTRTTGGTAYTVRYAERAGVRVIDLAKHKTDDEVL